MSFTAVMIGFLVFMAGVVWAAVVVGVPQEYIAIGAAVLPERGTARSIREAVRAAFNLETEIAESGATTWSTIPDSAPPGEEVPDLLVLVVTDEPDAIDRRRLDEVVRSAKPAHVPHRIEVVASRRG